jgi:hypothetical protein
MADMTEIDLKFKMAMINMPNALMEKVGNRRTEG